jgi:hypothetical protein
MGSSFSGELVLVDRDGESVDRYVDQLTRGLEQ